MKLIKHIIIKEFLQLRRDPKLFRMIFIAPILQLVFLGYAATMDINNINVVVMDNDRSQMSRELLQKFEGSGYYTINKYTNNIEEINEELDKSNSHIALVLPQDFEEKLYRKEPVAVQVIFDGSDGNKASIIAGYTTRILSNYNMQILTEIREKSGLKKNNIGSISSEIRVWYNPDLKTRNFMLPGIMGLILMVTTSILMSMAIVKEREIGTLEQLIVTPIKPYQLIVGKLIPFVIIGFIDVLIVQGVMVYWFGIDIRGSFLFLLFASLLFVLSTLGIGLFVSTISKTQQQAMLISLFAIMMPMVYLSGFAFPIENMPKVIQYITYAIPLRYYIIIVRGVILKGTGFWDLLPNVIALFLMGASILVWSSLRFKKRLE